MEREGKSWLFWLGLLGGAGLVIGGMTAANRNRILSILKSFSNNAGSFWSLFHSQVSEGTFELPALDETLNRAAQANPVGFLEWAVQWVNQRITWVADQRTWGVRDYWQSPHQTLLLGHGDCEDQSLLLFKVLWQAGFRDPVLVLGTAQGEGHAWIELGESRAFLDPTSGKTLPNRPPSYEPAVWITPDGFTSRFS